MRPWAATLLLLALSGQAAARPAQPPLERFFIMGDGTLKIRSTKSRFRFVGRYRDGRGRYRPTALRAINRVFGAEMERDGGRVSLRLIELISRLRQELRGGWVVVSSGYRGPRYNARIRARGGTVALSSLHQYGMAADLRMSRVKSKRIWGLMRQRRWGGAGYYNSPWVHVDVGYPRSWTQGSANVRKGRSVQNKLIQLVPWVDIHRAGERLELRFVRMTAFPIGVERRWQLERATPDGGWAPVRRFRPSLGRAGGARCPQFASIAAMARVRWRLPATLPTGRYRVRAWFCQRKWQAMPAETVSRAFRVVGAPASRPAAR